MKNKGEDGTGFRSKNRSRLGGPPGQPGQIVFSLHGRAGTGLDFLFRGRGRDWIFYFAGRPARGRDWIFYFADGTGFFALQLGSDDEVPW